MRTRPDTTPPLAGPRIHEYLQELHEKVLSKYEHAYTVGETAGSNEPEILLKYIRPERKELDTVFVRSFPFDASFAASLPC